MVIIIKTKKEIDILKEGGKKLGSILKRLAKEVRPGISTKELDSLAFQFCKEEGGEPAFLNYQPEGARIPYPASLCISVNDEVVHGIPSALHILKEGDIVSLDLGLKYKGLFTDSAITVPVGKISKEDLELLKNTKKALLEGIKEVKAGNYIGDIGYAIEKVAKKNGYGVVRILSGHGVGKEIHEDPFIPNYGKRGSGVKLVVGMVIALEPMFNLGGDNVNLMKDGYTYKTTDGKKSAHFEHSMAVTERGCVVLTE